MVEMDLEKQLSSLQEAALEERADFERIISEMSEKIQQLEEQHDNSEETEQWANTPVFVSFNRSSEDHAGAVVANCRSEKLNPGS